MAEDAALVLGGRVMGALEVLRSPVVTWRTGSPTWWDALLVLLFITANMITWRGGRRNEYQSYYKVHIADRDDGAKL